MLIISSFKTPAGWLDVSFDEHYVYHAVFTESPAGLSQIQTTQAERIASELDSYFSNCNHRFQLALKPEGTPFQQRVWNALLVIPAGRTLTYGELAVKLQSSPRAIGQACRKNPITLFIPCHRIVGKSSQGGYMGRMDALCYKTNLLDHEKASALLF